MGQKYVLPKRRGNPDEAIVDDVTLVAGGEAKELTDDQFERLKDAVGRLEKEGESSDDGDEASAEGETGEAAGEQPAGTEGAGSGQRGVRTPR